ncbi:MULTISPECIES: DUF6302 family protein [unclassified Streptomyces]|uniref:DUF6302 family protein n=1 Tax=unclassified Streptomyces TaxID=2593676 RepID=UPI00341403B5
MKDTLEADRASMQDRLADPGLLEQAVEVRVGERDGVVRYRLAVPVGGARRAGYLTVADYAEALATLAMLDGRPGFPHVRLRGTVTSRDSRRTIIWGDDPPTTDAAARWKFYGYSDTSISRYAQQTPEGERAIDHPSATVLDTS